MEPGPHQFRGDRHVSWAPRRLPSKPGSHLAVEARVLDTLALAPWRPSSVPGQSLPYLLGKEQVGMLVLNSCSELCLPKSNPKSPQAGMGCSENFFYLNLSDNNYQIIIY